MPSALVSVIVLHCRAFVKTSTQCALSLFACPVSAGVSLVSVVVFPPAGHFHADGLPEGWRARDTRDGCGELTMYLLPLLLCFRVRVSGCVAAGCATPRRCPVIAIVVWCRGVAVRAVNVCVFLYL